MPETQRQYGVSDIIAYEQGELQDSEVIELFASLIKSGLAWTLQGHYGRTATTFIDAGWISPEGEVLAEIVDSYDIEEEA